VCLWVGAPALSAMGGSAHAMPASLPPSVRPLTVEKERGRQGAELARGQARASAWMPPNRIEGSSILWASLPLSASASSPRRQRERERRKCPHPVTSRPLCTERKGAEGMESLVSRGGQPTNRASDEECLLPLISLSLSSPTRPVTGRGSFGLRRRPPRSTRVI
jgi:hypothetical protein